MPKYIAAVLLLLTLSSPSGAEISNEAMKAYNVAQENGTRAEQVDSARALAAEAVKNPEHPSAGLIAYETAWTLVRLGHIADARSAAQLALQVPVGEKHPTEAKRNLLARYIDWRLSAERETRRELDEALEAAVQEQPSLLTSSVYQDLYLAAFKKERWRKAASLASAAAQHAETERKKFLDFWAWSKLFSLISEFYQHPRRSTLRKMAHLHGQLTADILSFEEEIRPDWLRDVSYRTYAWRLTFQVFYASTTRRSQERIEREMEEIFVSYLPTKSQPDADVDVWSAESAPGSAVNEPHHELWQEVITLKDEIEMPALCKGALSQDPPLKYPETAKRRRLFGTVILGFRLDKGKLEDLKILASVPDEGFKQTALETAAQWRYIPSEDAERPCSLDAEEMLLPIVFRVQ